MNSQNQMAIYGIVVILFILAFGEYALHFWVFINPAKWVIIAYKFYKKGGIGIRILCVILYPLCFTFQNSTLQINNDTSFKKNYRKDIIGTIIFSISAIAWVYIHKNPYPVFFFPMLLLGVLIGGIFLGNLLKIKPENQKKIPNDKEPIENPYSFSFAGSNGSWVNVPDPFRGILVIGAAGSGKSYSVAEPIIEQTAQKGYSGIIYDFKFPSLTDFAFYQYQNYAPQIGFYVINFQDLNKTHRVNALDPKYIPTAAYAEEYSTAIISNLMPESIQRKDFWIRSSTAMLTATIWYMRKHHPKYCTIPHVVNLILSENYNDLINLFREDYECAAIVRSIITAIDQKANEQISGVISTLQIALARINTQEIAYVLSGNDFSLDLNNPQNPKLLCLGTSPSLVEAFAPLISCICTVALKSMNQQNKHHSFVLLDEAPTLYIPKFEQIPATARSNKVVTIFMAQDLSQIEKNYGMKEAETIVSNLNNHFYGRVANIKTAETVSKIIGKADKIIKTESQGSNRPTSWFETNRGSGSSNQGISITLQERQIIQPQDVFNLQVGEFIGTTVGAMNPNFYTKLRRQKTLGRNLITVKELPMISKNYDILLNFNLIISECKAILKGIEIE